MVFIFLSVEVKLKKNKNKKEYQLFGESSCPALALGPDSLEYLSLGPIVGIVSHPCFRMQSRG